MKVHLSDFVYRVHWKDNSKGCLCFIMALKLGNRHCAKTMQEDKHNQEMVFTKL